MVGKQIPAGTGFHNIKGINFKDTRESEREYVEMDEETNKLFEENDDL